MSKREEIRKKRQNQARQQQLVIIGVVAVVAVLIVGAIIWPNLAPVGEITTPSAYLTPPQPNGKVMGDPNAKVVITEYSDFQCPICKRFATDMLPQIVTTFIETGQARFEYKHYIVIDGNVGGDHSRKSAEASECMAKQNLFYPYLDIVYANQGDEGSDALSNNRLKAMAALVPGADASAFNTCFDSAQYATQVSSDAAEGSGLGVNGTPTIFINGVKISNPFDMAEFKRVITAASGQ